MKRYKKSFNILLIFTLSVFSLIAEELVLAPIVVLDSENQKITLEKNPNEKIFEQLREYWFDGLLNTQMLEAEKYGLAYSVIDAERMCSLSSSNYAIYGYIQENETSWYGNLKMYDFSQKKIIKEFFASDDLTHYERLISNLTTNIVSGLEEVLGHNTSIFKNSSPFQIYIPINLYYWTMLDDNWKSVFFGIAGINTGFEFYPHLKKNVFKSFMLNFSLRPQVSYSYAMSASNFNPLNYNSIMIGLPIALHFHFNKKHDLYFGSGPYYEIEMLQIQEKYSEQQFLYQGMFGLLSFVGYGYDVNNTVRLFFETEFDFHFSNDSFYVLKPTMGIAFNIYKEAE